MTPIIPNRGQVRIFHDNAFPHGSFLGVVPVATEIKVNRLSLVPTLACLKGMPPETLGASLLLDDAYGEFEELVRSQSHDPDYVRFIPNKGRGSIIIDLSKTPPNDLSITYLREFLNWR